MFEETLYQDSSNGKPFVDVVKANGIIPGIKVDSLKPFTDGVGYETWCSGLDGLVDNHAKGARLQNGVALRIGDGMASE